MLKFDGANGVGALKMRSLLTHLGEGLEVEIFNSGEEAGDVLNHECGADFVKVNQRPPRGMTQLTGQRCVSVDGDADRVIYSFNDEKSNTFNMLDGDKIATLGEQTHLKPFISLSKVSFKY